MENDDLDDDLKRYTERREAMKQSKDECLQRLAKLESEADELRKYLQRVNGGIEFFDEEIARMTQEKASRKTEAESGHGAAPK